MPGDIFHVPLRTLQRFFDEDKDGWQLKRLVDALLEEVRRAPERALPATAFVKDLPHNRGDQGVDAAVHLAISDEESGWFHTPTVWQFKRSEVPSTPAKVKEQLKGDLVQQYLKDGYAYRWVVARELSPQKQAKCQCVMTAAISEVLGTAPVHDAAVIDLGRLQVLLSYYPIVLARKGFHLLEIGADVRLPEDAWEHERRLFRKTHWSTEWRTAQKQALAPFVRGEFSDPILRVVGRPGIGKTRFVVEALGDGRRNKLPWLYVLGEHAAIKLCRALRGHTGLIVADRISEDAVSEIREELDRLRCVVICADAPYVAWRREGGTFANVLELSPHTDETVVEILTKNKHGSVVNRPAAAAMSQGSPRFAHVVIDASVVAGGRPPLRDELASYLRKHIGADAFQLLSLISLADRVGYAGDRAVELGSLLEFFCTSTNSAHAALMLNDLRDRNLFVQSSDRYCEVSPPVASDVFLESLWRSLEENGRRLLRAGIPTLPEDLQLRMHSRLSRAPAHIRRAYSGSFLDWARGLELAGLASTRNGEKFVHLLTADPPTYLALLRDWLQAASDDEIEALSGDRTLGDRGTRRTILFALDALGYFTEYFPLVEAVLFEFMRRETEECVNNATGMWADYFAPVLAPTAYPFAERVALLAKRLDCTDDRATTAFKALSAGLGKRSGRALSQRTVGGRLLPERDGPKTHEEWRQRERILLDLVIDRLRLDHPRRAQAWDVALQHLHACIDHNGVDELRSVLKPSTDAERRELARALERHLDFVDRYPEDRQPAPAVRAEITQWRDVLWSDSEFAELQRLAFGGGGDYWWMDKEEEARWRAAIASQVRSLSTDVVLSALESIETAPPHRLAGIGGCLPPVDGQRLILKWLLANLEDPGRFSMLLGYLRGLAWTPADRRLVDAAIAGLPDEDWARDVKLTLWSDCGKELDGIQRITGTLQDGNLPWTALRHVMMHRAMTEATNSELAELVAKLADALEREFALPDPTQGEAREAADGAGAVASDLARAWDRPSKSEPKAGVAFEILQRLLWLRNDVDSEPEERRACEAAWLREFEGRTRFERALSVALTNTVLRRHSTFEHSAKSVLLVLREADDTGSEWVCSRLLELLDNPDAIEFADALIAEHLAPTQPERVMQEVGRRLLDPSREPYLSIHKLETIGALPVSVLVAWIKKHPPEGAAAIACHLPRPTATPELDPAEQDLEFPTVTVEVMNVAMERWRDDVSARRQITQRFTYGPSVSGLAPVPNAEGFAQLVGAYERLARNADHAWMREWANARAEWTRRDAEMRRRNREERDFYPEP